MMKYKGYYAVPQYNQHDKCFYGKIMGISDVVGFEGRTVDELENEFKESVEDYIETCREIGKEPEKSFSGKLNLRLGPELHARAASIASQKNKSLNQYLVEVISDSLDG